MGRLVIVSNRVPLPEADSRAGGLAVVLADLLEQRGGLWFGWSGEISDASGISTQRAGRVDYATIDLSQAEHDGFYTGFSNSVLWPLLHMMPALIAYRREDAETYRAVNARIADELAGLLRPEDVIWVQDYHLLALPAALRARGMRNRIGFFLHIPFPPAAMLSLVPGIDGLVGDLLHADLLGFQTNQDTENFHAAALALADAQSLGPQHLATAHGTAWLGTFPVEIEPAAFAALAEQQAAQPAAMRLAASLDGQTLILGVDRLDPTKGLPERLEGFARLLERHPHWRGRVTLLQIAASSRGEVDAYRSLRTELESLAGRINADFATADWTPIRLITRGCDRETVAGYMRHARIGLVTPLRDGMNVVAKEYIAAQDAADPGVLILSRFAGAAEQLTDALLINPNDPDSITDALDLALRMTPAARLRRWAGAWEAIGARTARLWGDGFLAALSDRHGTTAIAASATSPLPMAPMPNRPAATANQIIRPDFGLRGHNRPR